MSCAGNPALRCLIVDDSVAFRDSARVVLERDGITVVGFAATGAEAISLYRQLRPDVTLVDVDLGDESGFRVVEDLHRACAPVTATIMTSTHDEQELADLIAASPALGFLPKFALSPQAIRRLTRSDRPADGPNGSPDT